MQQTPQINAVGSPAAPATLTASFAGNVFNTSYKYFNALHLDFDYTPGATETSNYIEIRIRYSNDDGTTFRERTLKVNSTTETKLYPAVPLVFPGAKDGAGGVEQSGVHDEEGATADLIEIAVREVGVVTNFGTCYIGAVLSDPNLST